MMKQQNLSKLIDMITSMARLDFSKKLETDMSNDPMDVLSYGLNMLSEELQSQVEEKNRLQDMNHNLERYSFTIAHDLKSPALASTGVIDLLETELQEKGSLSKDDLQQYLSMLREANRQTIKMINGILEYSRLENTNIITEEVDLARLCTKLRKEYAWMKHVKFNIQKGLPKVYHNEVALNQVFNNLINNAIKHNNKDICTIDISHRFADDFHYITISDNGPGIAAKDQAVIFNLFENLQNNAQESTGLGLAIVDKIITRSNGKIWVETDTTEGASFTFTIPSSQRSLQFSSTVSV